MLLVMTSLGGVVTVVVVVVEMGGSEELLLPSVEMGLWKYKVTLKFYSLHRNNNNTEYVVYTVRPLLSAPLGSVIRGF